MTSKLIKRKAYVNQLKDYVNTDFVKVYTGIRRSGKTSLMHNIIDEIKSMGVKDENIIFISFESREYSHIDNSQQLDEIVYSKTENLQGKIYLFFDEIQSHKDWEKHLKPLVDHRPDLRILVSGSAAGVDEACALADAAGLRCVKLAVSAPFHCALMEPAARRLEEEFKSVAFNRPSVPVYMNVDGNPVTDGAGIAGLLVRQAMSPVRWVRTLENMRADGIDTFVECGAGKTLRLNLSSCV